MEAREFQDSLADGVQEYIGDVADYAEASVALGGSRDTVAFRSQLARHRKRILALEKNIEREFSHIRFYKSWRKETGHVELGLTKLRDTYALQKKASRDLFRVVDQRQRIFAPAPDSEGESEMYCGSNGGTPWEMTFPFPYSSQGEIRQRSGSQVSREDSIESVSGDSETLDCEEAKEKQAVGGGRHAKAKRILICSAVCTGVAGVVVVGVGAVVLLAPVAVVAKGTGLVVLGAAWAAAPVTGALFGKKVDDVKRRRRVVSSTLGGHRVDSSAAA